MNPSVCTPFAFMCTAIASAINASLCGVLNTHFVFGFAGSTIRDEAAIEIIGVSAADATSTIASEFGVIVEPTTTSTLSSVMSFFVLVTAFVVSEASSRTIQLIFWPLIVVGRSSIVFFSGMPSDAAGPVAESVTPTLMSARTAPGAATASAAATSDNIVLRFMSPPPEISALRYFLSASRISRSSTTSSGGAAGLAGSARRRRLICFTIRKMMKARIRKLSATVMKLP